MLDLVGLFILTDNQEAVGSKSDIQVDRLFVILVRPVKFLEDHGKVLRGQSDTLMVVDVINQGQVYLRKGELKCDVRDVHTSCLVAVHGIELFCPVLELLIDRD